MVEKINANRRTGNEIAVIGMAGRFPGAKNIPEFWENLKNGVESMYFLSDEEIKKILGTALTDIDGYVRSGGGVLEDMEHFDAQFFGYTPREAEIMNPQTRLFHECAWSALEDAGYNPESFRGSIGLYAGASNSFDWEALLRLSGRDQAYGDFAASQLYDKDFLSTLVAHSLNLRGPVLTLHTACSTSLVAIHLACQALLDGECDMALAGGVTVYTRRSPGYIYQEGLIFSPDGHCRAFDANSKGTVGGNGLGIVVLKNLEEAETDGDHIYAVVKGTALNNDGSNKATYSAPSREGQTAVIRLAHQVAEVEPESITYIETHGTGTDLGDPIEIEALKQAFRIDKKGFCAIGALKTSMGHLDCAAGVASFIKTVLAIKHRLIPPILHYQSPNPNIDFENSPFYVNTRLKEWKNDKYPLRAGISSFGIGGTNAHIILEECSEGTGGPAPLSDRQYRLILLSAHTRSALEKMTENLANHLKKNPDIDLGDAAYTLQMGRKALRYRGMTVCATLDETIDTLSSPKSIKFQTSPYSIKDENRPIVFMFSGQGSQYVNMGLELYQNEPVFRREVDRCIDILEKQSGYHIKDILYPSPGKETEAKEKIDDVLYSGPVKFTFEYALAKLLMNWGIRPYAMIGHSFGEYTVAQLAGVFSLEEALSLVVLRGKSMQKIPDGAMMSVPLPEAELKTLLKLNDKLSLAAVNTRSLCIVSGPTAVVDQFEKDLNKKGQECLRINFPRASHSNMMIPIFQEFAQAVSRAKLNPPGIPYISGLTGNWISVEDATDPRYWARHLVEPVRFSDGIEKILKKQPDSIFLQIGCDRGLPLFVNQQPGIKTENLILNLVGHQKEKVSDLYYIQHKIGLLWINGVKINWHNFFPGEKRRRIPLPHYPFERQPYWIHGNPYAMITNRLASTGAIRKADITDWYYIPSWIRTPLPINRSAANLKEMEKKSNWLVFIDEYGVGTRLVDRLNQEGHTVIAVKIGKEYARETGTLYRINHQNKDHYDALLKDLAKRSLIPNGIAHLWSVHRNEKSAADLDFLAELRDRGFCSLVYLAQAVGNQTINTPLFIGVVTESMQEVGGNEALSPGSATVLGPIKVIPAEYPNIDCRSIDILLPEPGSPQEDRLVSQLALELQSIRPETIVAYRGSHRWTQTFKPFPLEKPDAGSGILKKQGVYLITGGLGGMGLELAEFLAKSVDARLVLTGRSAFPPKEEWTTRLETQAEEGPISAKIRKLQELEELGAEVLILSADVTDQQQMEEVIHQVIDRYGQINGVIHAAGDPGGGIIQAQTMETITRVLNPKVLGTVTLNRVLKDIDLDFFILWSSAGSIMSTFGQAGYCSANAFLDAFADYNTTTNGRFTTAINWTRWKKIGMAAPVELMHQQMTGEELAGGMTAAEGIEAFSRILGQRVPRIVAIESDFVREWEQFNQLREAGTPEQLNFQEDLAEGKPAAVLFPRPELKTPYTAPRDKLEQVLADIWQELFGLEQVGIDDDFFELGGDSLRGMRFVNKYNELLKEIVHVNVIFSAPTIAELAVYFKQHYPDALARMLGITTRPAEVYPTEKIDTAIIDRMRQIIPPPPPRPGIETSKNPPAIFLLSPPRSGSTLLRVILTGHPKLFAPPELGLMAFNTLNDPEFVDQGSIRAVMELQDCTREKAQEIMQNLRDRQVTGKEFYRMMQDWLGDRILVDKTPNYGLLLEVLKRIEADFENPFYIHLLRHPYGMIRSFDEAKMDLVSGSDLLKKLSLTRLQYAELTWTINHQNIQEFLKDIPPQRQYRVVFEELVSQPRVVVRGICRFLGLDFHQEMLQPYGDKKKRMTDGIYKEGMMIGDMKFHTYKRIETGVADTWKKQYHTDFLGDVTWELAETFGYKRVKETIYSSINPVEKKDYYALSSAQKRLYILQQMEGISTAYNIPITIYLAGQPDTARLEQTFRKLIKRHESLRTTFEMRQEEPIQRIHEEVDFAIEVFAAADNNVEKIKKEFSRPFDFARAPLLRVGLLNTPSNYQLLIDAHHIITDRTSHIVLTEEFLALSAQEVELSPLRLQYKDYSQWQNSQAVKESFQHQEEYWLKNFQGEIPILNLPLDYSRPAVQSFEGAVARFALSGEVITGLSGIARSERATLFMVLMAIYNVFLAKISNQEDIIVGTDMTGRNHMDLEHIIGMFINTLPLRNFPAPEKAFKDFLTEVKETTIKAMENRDYQFEDLVEKVAVSRDMSRNPMFDVNFALLEIEAEPVETPGQGKRKSDLKQEPFIHEKQTTKFDLTWMGAAQVDSLSFSIEYCTKLFKPETIQRFATYFKQTISSVILASNLKISEIQIIPENERKKILFEFNDNRADFCKQKTPGQIIQEQAASFPDRTAVNFQGAALTYCQLDEASNQLAGLLREKGISRDGLVAVLCERSPEMLTAILAVWKAGGAYIPIDSNYPLSRIDDILANSGAAVILTRSDTFPDIRHFYREIGSHTEVRDIIYLDKQQDLQAHHRLFKTLGYASLLSRCPQPLVDRELVLRYENQTLAYQELINTVTQIRYFISDREIDLGPRPVLLFTNPLYKIAALLYLNSCGIPAKVIEPGQGKDGEKRVIDEYRASSVFSQGQFLDELDRLLWESETVKQYFLLDNYDFRSTDKESQFRDIWDYVAEESSEAINDYGWTNSYTNEPFTIDEMNEYIRNFKAKLAPHLTSHSRVLDIGCGHGLVLAEISPHVGYYLATDLSPVIIEKNKVRFQKSKQHNRYNHVEFKVAAASDIHLLNERDFDLIICSSVIHYFPNTLYLEEWIKSAIGLLKDQGIIYLDDLMDLGKKSQLVQSTSEFKRNHPQAQVKTNWDDDLFVPIDFFHYLYQKYPEIVHWESSRKLGRIDNELTRFRYDIKLKINKQAKRKKSSTLNQKKNRYTFRDIEFHYRHSQNSPGTASSNPQGMIDVDLPGENGPGKIAAVGNVSDIDTIKTYSKANLQPINDGSDLGYVIYTSGSTGKPKGVMVEHAGMMNHLQAKIAELQLGKHSIIAQNASHTFDISVWQFIAALLVGGKTIIYPDRLILNPDQFIARIIKDQVNILEIVPSYLAVMLEYMGNRPLLLPLHYLLVTGEELKPTLAARWFEKYPGIKMVNAYGPTEASDDITHFFMDKAPDTERIPIGKPLPNLNIYIVDNHMKLCPLGVKGEICVSGIGVGRGYWRDEAKTSQSFMADPFAAEPGIRLYKTGDLGRWLPNGTIEFFGRKDYQVKVRGFRIELGEIEVQLASYPGINAAVVIAADTVGQAGIGSTAGEAAKNLCAYFVPNNNNITASGLREYLEKELPAYMIPSYFVPLEKLPLTPNGKVDRKALPKPWLELDEGQLAPQNPVEEKLAEIWSKVLGIEENAIGAAANFFELGGHSLNATIFAAKVHRELNVKLPMAEIFKTPTIRDLSQYINNAIKEKFLSIMPVEEKEYYRLSPAQERLFFINLFAPQSTSYNVPTIAALSGTVDKDHLAQTFKKLVTRHESLRTSFSMLGQNQGPIQKILKSIDFAIEYHDLAAAGEAGKINEMIQNFVRPFDLSQAPLLRVRLFKENNHKYILMVDRHHIISDGISDDILVHDFISLYRKQELPRLRLQYKDFSEWQHQWLTSAVIKKQGQYWLDRFKGEIPVLDLPTDYPRPSIMRSDEGGVVDFTIEKELTAAIHAATRETGTTLFMFLLAVYTILLAKYSSQEDIVVGSPVTGRRHDDLQDIIGMFVNMLALRNLPIGDKTFKEFLAEVKTNAVDAYENQDFQFDELISRLGVQGTSDRHPLFNVVFASVILDEPQPTPTDNQPSDLNVKPLDISKYSVKFDLRMAFAEQGEVILLSLSYFIALFKPATIEKMAARFIEILDQVVKNPGIKLKDLTLSHELVVTRSHTLKQYEEEFEF